MNIGWKHEVLGNLLRIQNGFAFDSKSFSGIEGTSLIRIRDLKNGVITETRYNGCYEAKYVVNAGDLLIGMDGEFACYEWKGNKALLNQRVCKLDGFASNLLPKFVFYGINSYLKAIEDITGFTTVKHLSSRQIASIRFPVPPLPEQKRIVAILDEAFESINTAIANTEKNLANARELFESYLSSIFARRHDGWTDKTLPEVSIDFGRGKSKHRPRNDPRLYGGPYPFIQTGDIRNCNHVVLESTQSYNEVGLAQSKLWPKGTICITIAANIAETGILGFDSCFPDSVIGIVVDETQTTIDYVEYLLQSVKAILKAQGKGSAQDNINLTTFENRRFPFPPLHEQKTLVMTLNELSTSMQKLEAIYALKLDALEELKKAILQRAFAGELTARTAADTLEAAE